MKKRIKYSYIMMNSLYWQLVRKDDKKDYLIHSIYTLVIHICPLIHLIIQNVNKIITVITIIKIKLCIQYKILKMYIHEYFENIIWHSY